MISASLRTPQTRRLLNNLRTLPRDIRAIESREINRQMRTSIGGTGSSRILPVVGMVRQMSKGWGISPQKRIRRRILWPKGAQSTPRTLTAEGLSLFETLPMRYFESGLPSGAKAVPSGRDSVGRTPFGGAFTVRLNSGATGKMRKLAPQKWGDGGARNRNPEHGMYLPIGWAEYADVSKPMDSIRQQVLTDLAKFFPVQMDEALAKFFKRRFG